MILKEIEFVFILPLCFYCTLPSVSQKTDTSVVLVLYTHMDQPAPTRTTIHVVGHQERQSSNHETKVTLENLGAMDDGNSTTTFDL